MSNVLLVIHLMLAIAMIGVVLLQRSEGGGLGIGGGGGGGGGGMGGFLTGRGTANLLTRATAVLAGCFMLTSITLTILASGANERRSIVDQIPATAPAQEEPAIPSVPVQ
jgi:preprotein translocase subunit SecG